VFNSIVASTAGKTLLAKDAPKIATGVGMILGADGDVLTQVADTFGTYIGNLDLPAASAATFAKDLIKGAVKGLPATVSVSAQTIPPGNAPVGAGGQLNVGATISASTVNDLVAIVDVLANGIIQANGTASAAAIKSDATEIGALAAAVAKFTKNETFDSGITGVTQPQPVAAFLAGTLADQVMALTAGDTAAQTAINTAITKSVTAITNSSVDLAVKAAIADPLAYPVVGEVTPQETTITNL
jgi:hypothetical protein